MTEIHTTAFAKLNLSIDVLSRRRDGYHEMLMVMQSAALCDRLSIRLTDDGIFRARTGLRYLPGDERNIAVRAARLFFAKADIPCSGAQLMIEKNIPVGAGMGGGSSDAAAVLRALNHHFGHPLGLEELKAAGASLGLDVPFCVLGGTALATGRGERLRELAPMPPCYIVICKPEFSISTASLFAKLDCEKIRHRPDTPGIIGALEKGDLCGLSQRMYNIFEGVLPRQYGEVFVIKKKLLDNGAMGVSMTGTGPAVFGLFSQWEDADFACSRLRREYKSCCLTQTLGKLDWNFKA